MKRIKKIIIMLYWNIIGSTFRIMPINNKKVLFESFLGRYYSDNPRSIYEYMVENDMDYQYIWIFNEPNLKEDLNKGKKIKRMRIKYLYHLYTSKYIVSNSRLPLKFKKREKQIYIQTWHGTPLKKLVFDMEKVELPGANAERYKSNFKKDADKWDYLIVPNEYSKKIFPKAFQYTGKLIYSGYPRNDRLKNISNSQNEIKEIKTKLGIKNQKVILYTPTFRDNKYIKKGHYYQEINLDINRICKDENVIFLLRTHYLVKEKSFKYAVDKNNFIDVSRYEDIVDLYLISDLLITDYSSTFFDYSLLERPIVFYQYDYEEYKNDLRDFYITSNQLPSKILKTKEEVEEEIKLKLFNIKDNKYNDGYNNLNIKEYEKNSSQKVIDIVFEK